MFFFNDTATTEIYTLSLHDALPIYVPLVGPEVVRRPPLVELAHDPVARHLGEDRRRGDAGGDTISLPHRQPGRVQPVKDRKSTRLNSSHANISYAVFCLKKKYSLYS